MSNKYEYKEELKALLPEYMRILEDMGMTEESVRLRDFWDCPFCGSGRGENHTPAFHLNHDGTRYKCFSCGKSGDIFDFVRYVENMEDANYPKVYNKTKEIMEAYLEKQIHFKEVEKWEREKQDYSEYLAECHLRVFLTDYFHNRGLSDCIINKYQLGYDPKHNIVTIPYNAGHRDTGYIQRTLWASENKYIKHGNELFNIDAIQKNASKCVFITEGQMDAMSFEEIGYPALGLGGVNEVNRLIELIGEMDKYLILALDNDVPGRKATGKVIEAIAKMEFPCHVMTMSWIYGGYKDANEFLVKDREGFEKQIEKIVSVM